MTPETNFNAFEDFDFDGLICYGNDDDLHIPISKIADNNTNDSQPSTRKSSYEEPKDEKVISDAVKYHIEKFMTGEEVHEDDMQALNDYEKCVVRCIQTKKTKPKTKEQNIKQVMRPAFKKLKDKYFRSRLKKPNKKKLQTKDKDEDQFYQYYFGDIIKDDKKTTIENFY